MRGTWADFVGGRHELEHGVQIYGDVGELFGGVASYLGAGIDRGEPAIVIATHEHVAALTAELHLRGWDARRLEKDGMLVFADAEATLARVTNGSRPSKEAFDRVVGSLLDRVGAREGGRRARVFGEMVDLLRERGRERDALTVEELWNDLARRRPFSLLCGYRLDVFDRETQSRLMPDLCRVHTHVFPAADSARLSRAVNRALTEVLGDAEAGKIYVVIADQVRQDRVPPAQLALMWISEHMPVLAERILSSSRAYYAGAGSAAR